jgi:hypothetical protein
MRLISNLTALLFGFIFATMLFLAAFSDGADMPQTWIGIVVFYQAGKVVNSESIGFASNQNDCVRGVMSIMPLVAAKNPGFGLMALCTVAPPAPEAPPATDPPAQSKQLLPGQKKVDHL